MNFASALRTLHALDIKGRYVYRSKDLAKIFSNDSQYAFRAGLERLVKNGTLTRAARDVYVFAYSRNIGADTTDLVAKSLRRGHYNYVSLETALSIYGVISQVPVDRLTVLTTGREGEFRTPFGVIDFTHTKRSVSEIIDNTIYTSGQSLRIATKLTAYRDLKRVGRNTHLVDESELYE